MLGLVQIRVIARLYRASFDVVDRVHVRPAVTCCPAARRVTFRFPRNAALDEQWTSATTSGNCSLIGD